MNPAHRGVLITELQPLSGLTILITGAGGMLGSAFQNVLERIPGCNVVGLDRHALDVTDRPAVLALAGLSPHVILHCAAEVNADRCERHPDECRRVQVGGTANVIALAKATGARVVYPQSVFVFDGREVPVSEDTAPNPLSEYGRAKLTAEHLLVQQLPESLVVRMAGFFGGDARDKNFVGSFVDGLFERLERNERTCRIGERVWQPSYTSDLAENTLLLLALERTGIYHMGSHGEASFFEVACACVDDLGLSSLVTVDKLPPPERGGIEIAPRPYRIVTANARLAAEGLDRQRHWRGALATLFAPVLSVPRAQARRDVVMGAHEALEERWQAPFLGPLQSRVVMSAMTRDFADANHCATPAMAEYYARRAAGGVGLILTEGTIVHPSGDGYRSVPRLCTNQQTESWRPVTSRAHDHGALIFCQLWHCGRISHPDFLDGGQPVSSTDRAAEGINRQNGKPYGVPRRLRTDELPGICEMFATAAGRALRAGFDGVELHMGHGYLPDQFFDARVNDRRDAYGGTVENRCRFGVELVRAVVEQCGPARVMTRLSPARFMNGPYDWTEMEGMLAHLIPELARAGLRMLDISCGNASYFETSGRVIRLVRPQWPHLLVGGASLTQHEAQGELDAGFLDLITWGRALIANPDLVQVFRSSGVIRPFDRSMLQKLE